jgi:putative ABC transport system permease protein
MRMFIRQDMTLDHLLDSVEPRFSLSVTIRHVLTISKTNCAVSAANLFASHQYYNQHQMNQLRQDLHFALRILLRNPGFTAAAVLCLALGIGATTAIFSVVYAVVLRPLPYKDPGKLVRLYTEFPTFPGGGLRRFWTSRAELLDLKRDLKSWETLDGWTNSGANLVGADQPVRVQISVVTGTLLETLGVQPLRGRLINARDDLPSSPQVAVISEGLWKRAFGSDPAIIGRDARVDGRPCTIVGVMPAGFQFPPGEVDPTELWIPLQIDPANPGGRGNHFLFLLGRLAPDRSLEQAKDELNRLVEQTGANASPNTHLFHPRTHPLVAYPLHEEVISKVRPALLALLAAVGFVLLIACVNVANLLLARAEARQREIAVRRAIGADRAQLLRQFLTEGVVLSAISAIAGVAIAFVGLRLLLRFAGAAVPRAGEVSLDWRMLLFTAAVAIATGIFFGLAPMAQVLGRTLHDALKSGLGRATASTQSNYLRRAMVVAEIALALVLLIGSGLMVRAFWKLQAINVGLNPSNILTLRIALPQALYRENADVTRFWSSLQDRLRSLPGVTSATMMSGMPPERPLNANDTPIENFVRRTGGPIQNIDFYMAVGDRYFEAMQIPLIDGRYFDARDGETGMKALIVNQTLARTYWPGESALGKRMRPSGGQEWFTIVGVVGDVKNAGMDKPPGNELYLPYRQTSFGLRTPFVAIKTAGDPVALARAARAEIQAIDSSLPVASVRTMDEVIYASHSRPRFLAMLLTIFSAVALILAALGIYGVISYAVAQRTGEFGIRLAMGAQPASVLGMVLSQGMALAAVGIVAGALGAFLLTRYIKELLFQVDALDSITFVAMAATLATVAAFACYIPARRATRVDPMIALRAE